MSWEYYVGAVLCFGWCAPPYIYHSLSDAVAQYLRSQDISTSAWLDDFGCRTPGPRAISARPAKEGSPRGGGPRTHDLLPLRLLEGLSKMLTGIHHRPGLPGRRLRHGATRRFYVPEDKLRKLEAILRDAINSRSISLSQLKKQTRKCTSMSVTVPLASLYTHHMYRQIAAIKRFEGRKDLSSTAVSKRSGLRFEMERWLEMRTRLNGAPWYEIT